MSGKRLRISKFFNRESGAGLLVPIDHGLTIGPVSGLRTLSEIGSWINNRHLGGIIAHKGMVERLARADLIRGLPVMVHLNGMTSMAPCPDTKELVTRVEHAIRLGADAVSIQVNFDGDNEAHNLTMLGAVVDEAERFGMPVLTMLYDKAKIGDKQAKHARLRHLIRLTLELGTDALKLAAPESVSEVAELLEDAFDDTAVFFAGGPLCSDDELFSLARAVSGYEWVGLCVGRNVFQRPSPSKVIGELHNILAMGRAGGREALASVA
ncbi:MAG: aldolase [Deltaproteobacteria bacterium]|nr:aldolase [Deltaproteobacteria bacterium]